jgi:hypothetical protein
MATNSNLELIRELITDASSRGDKLLETKLGQVKTAFELMLEDQRQMYCALEPFALAAESTTHANSQKCNYHNFWHCDQVPTAGDFRRALRVVARLPVFALADHGGTQGAPHVGKRDPEPAAIEPVASDLPAKSPQC